MILSVVIVTYHTGEILKDCIRSVLAEEVLNEVIVISHGNNAETCNWLKQQKIIYLENFSNPGFAAGCNMGARVAKGENVLFLNPDCVVKSGSLKTAINIMRNNLDFWMAGCRVMLARGIPQPCNIRNLLSPLTAIGGTGLHRFGIGRKLDIDESDLPEGDIVPVPCISGAWMLIRKTAFQKIGGFDEKFFLHAEDADLCFNIQKMEGK